MSTAMPQVRQLAHLRAPALPVGCADAPVQSRVDVLRAYLESLKLRIGTFIGMAAVLGYLATLPTAPATGTASAGGSIAPGALGLLFLTTLAAAAGAGALNHYLDRDIDRLMRRTARRPLASGRIAHPWHVVALGLSLILMAVAFATWALNPLVALHVFLGAFTYVVVYTVWLKRRSWLNVVIGGLAGSFAVMGGGSLARPELCLPPLLFAGVLFFWSPSHFWSLAIAYRDEYAAARIPMLPAVRGAAHAARSILINTVALVVTAALAVPLGLLGPVYAVILVPGSVWLLVANVRLLGRPADRRLALQNFHAANLWLLLVFVAVLADVLWRA